MRDGGAAWAHGIVVLTMHNGMIGESTGLAETSLFALFGLPQQTGWPHRQAG